MSSATTKAADHTVSSSLRAIAFGKYTVAFMVAMLLYDVVGAFASQWALNDDVFAVASGGAMAQLCFLVLYFALAANSWIDGFLATCLSIAVSGGAIIFGMAIAHNARFGTSSLTNWLPPEDVLAAVLVFPGVAYAAIGPLLLARKFSHWRLVRPNEPCPVFPTSLASQFVNVVVIAGIVMTLRAPQVIWGFTPMTYWPTCGIVGLLICLISAAFTLPTAWIVNRESRLVQFGYLFGFAVLVWSTMSCLPWLLTTLGSRLMRFEPNYRSLSIAGLVATLMLYLGIRAIRSDGFLVQAQQGYPATQPDKKRKGRRAMIQVAFVIALTIAVNAYVGHVNSERQVLRDAGYKIREIIGPDGFVGSADYGAFNPIRPRIDSFRAPSATDAMAENILEIMRDAGALEQLKTVGFPNSMVSDECLLVVSQARNLKTLSVSDSKVSGRGFAHLSDLPLENLVAANLDLTKADWMGLPAKSLRYVSISGSKISSSEFTRFLSQPALDRLHTLNVASMDIDEAMMKAIATKVVQPPLNDHGRLLFMSDTSTTDEHIALLEDSNIHRLDLAGTQITDACLDSLLKINGLYSLDLSRTKLSDAIIPKLKQFKKLGCEHISVTGTQVTSNALLKINLLDVPALYVGSDKFTAAQITALTSAGYSVKTE